MSRMAIALLLAIKLVHLCTPASLTTSPPPTNEIPQIAEELCPPRGYCEEECRSYDIDTDGGLCKCDTDCEAYGDCCGPLPNQKTKSCEGRAAAANLDGLQFTCQSIFLDSTINVMKHEAFWMVSTCPTDWLDDIGESGEMVLEGCNSETRDLPPVTDTATGIVYKNQHCTLCNRVETLTLSWEPSIVCTSYLYQLLTTTPISELNASIFQEQCRLCSYQPPSSVRPPRACYPTIDSCSHRLPADVNRCENGSYNIVYGKVLFSNENIVYRNYACAECNLALDFTCLVNETFRGTNLVPRQCVPDVPPPTTEPPTTMSSDTTTPPPSNLTLNCNGTECPIPKPDTRTFSIIELETRVLRPVPPSPNQGIPFTITLSNLGRGQVTVKTEKESLNVTVNCPEGQAPVGLECRNTLCPDNFMSVDGRCFFGKNIDLIQGDNQTANESGNGTFLDCPTELVPLNDTEFTQLTNNTVLVDGMMKEVLGYSKDGQPLICPDNVTTVEVSRTFFYYPAGFLELTYIGCSLSVIGSSLVLITYGLFKELRSLPSKILMNLAFANLVTNLLILIGGPVSQAFPIAQLCTTVAILLHFFLLAQFSWMSVMSFEVVRKFHRAKKLIADSKHDKLRLLISYMVVGWGLPLLLTTVCIIVNFTATGLVLYGVSADGSLGSCWINHLESALIAFVAPLVLSLSFNLIMFVIVTVYIIMASRSQAKLKKEDSTPFFRLNIAIFCTTGLTWIFGFIAILAGASWAWYLFIIFNSTQGFVIFIAFLLNKKTLKLYIDFLTCKRLEKKLKSSSVSTAQTNTASVPPITAQSKQLSNIK